ncbi:hypothetical protein K8R04_00295 [Candidatus Uhrbacteria bacterium]|nr:hypothetical protein [Candidatus Uhrbacteria bacterium]
MAMEKQPGSKETRAFESKKTKESGTEQMRQTAESISNAGAEIKKGIEMLGSKNVSPESKKTIRSKLDSLKRTVARLGAVLAMSMPVAMLGHIALVEGSRSHEASSENTDSNDAREENEEYAPVAPLPVRFERTTDSEAQLAQQMLLDLAQLLREHEMGIDRTSESEITRLTAETAVENALQELGGSIDGPRLAERIRREIEGACSAPDCDTEQALAMAASTLQNRIDYSTRFAEADSNFEILSATSELNGRSSDTRFAVDANRPDLFEEGLRRRIDRASGDEEAMASIMEAVQIIQPFDLARMADQMSPEMQAQLRQALILEEQRLRDERATLVAAREAANREAEARRAARGSDPFASTSSGDTRTESDIEWNNELYRLDQELSRLNQTRNEMG